MQNEQLIADVSIKYIASEKKALTDKEAFLAQKILQEATERDLAQSHIDICA